MHETDINGCQKNGIHCPYAGLCGTRVTSLYFMFPYICISGEYRWKQLSYGVREDSGSVTVCLLRDTDTAQRTVGKY